MQSHAAATPGYEEDDAAIMPAPSQEYLAHVPHARAHLKGTPSGGSARFRNTIVPVLFTTAALMLAAAVLKYLVHPDAPLAAMPLWLAVVLAAAGVALIAVAMLNLLQLQRPASPADAGNHSGGPSE